LSTGGVLPAANDGLLAPVVPACNSVDAGIELVTAGLSLRSNFAWMLSGNVVYAVCQWGAIVALAKIGNPYMVGQFSLGLAIATPVLMFTNLHLRAVQATDALCLYSFHEYLRLRIALTILGVAVIAAIACFGNYERQTVLVILAIGTAKAIESVSDIHYGLFQLNDRLDETGKSMMLRGGLSVLAVGGGLFLTGTVFWACIALAMVWLFALLSFDRKHARPLIPARSPIADPEPRRPLRLMRMALPLGIATTMAAVNLNMPRYYIHARLGEHQLGIYSALAYSTVAMVLVSDSMGHSAIPRLSRLYTAGRFTEFRSLLVRLLASGATLGMAGLTIAICFGRRLLALIYGPEYSAQSRVFSILIVATAIYCVACMFTSAITAARCFRIQAPIYGLIVAANALACAAWVPTAGLAGAARALVVSATVHLVLGGTVVLRLLWTASDAARQ
jgi:O-antigen/teichoic acid export membrane protein